MLTFEASSVIIGALILVLTMVVCYMVLLLYKASPRAEGDTFMARTIYRPACGNRWLPMRRQSCRGKTRGKMPSIDNAYPHLTSCCTPYGPLTHVPVHAH